MVLTPKGRKILAAMERTYKSKEKAFQVFNAMIQEKKLTGVEGVVKKRKKKAKK